MQALRIAERDDPPALEDDDGVAGSDAPTDGEGEEEESPADDLPLDPPRDNVSDHADDETLVLGEGSPKTTGDSDHETDGEGSPVVDKQPMSPMSPGDVMGFGGAIGGWDPSSEELCSDDSGDETPNEPSGSKGPIGDLPPMPASDDEQYITPPPKPSKRSLPHESSQKDAKKHKPSKQDHVDACLKGLIMVGGFHTGFSMLMHLHCQFDSILKWRTVIFRSQLH